MVRCGEARQRLKRTGGCDEAQVVGHRWVVDYCIGDHFEVCEQIRDSSSLSRSEECFVV